MADSDLLALLGGGTGVANAPVAASDPYGLASFNNSVLSSDPYGLAARSLGSARFDTSTWSPGATAATSFGQAFLTGLLGRYAQQNAADQTNKLISVLPQLQSDPTSVIAPEGIDADAFANYKANAIIKNQVSQAQKQQGIAEMLQKIGLAKDIARAEVIGKNEGNTLSDPTGSIAGTPAYQAKQDTQNNAKSLDQRVTDARDYLKNSVEGQGLSALKPAVAQVVDNLDRTDKTADLAIKTALAKAIDPIGAISDQTLNTTEGALSLLDKAFGSSQGLLTDQGTFTREAKIKALQFVADKANSYANSYGKLVESEQKRLGALKADSSLLTHLDYSPFDVSKYTNAGPTIATTLPNGLDQNALLAEAAQLKSQGMAPADIAATLRQKYSTGSALTTPFGATRG